jgi:hypothetical protein
MVNDSATLHRLTIRNGHNSLADLSLFFHQAKNSLQLKPFSEDLILASVNPKYDKRLFIEFPPKYKFRTCCIQILIRYSKQYLYTKYSELVPVNILCLFCRIKKINIILPSKNLLKYTWSSW